MNKRIVTRNAYVRTSSIETADDDRQIEFIISSEAKDSHNTVFLMDGWDLKRYANNPIVCYQHRSNSDDPDDIIGTSQVYKEGNNLIGRVTFEPAEINPKAEKVYQKVLNGTLKMASVGAYVMKAHLGNKENGEDPDVLYFEKQQLMEWSIVSAGSNPDALKRNEETLDEIRTEVTPEITVNKPQEITNKRSVVEAQLLINKNK